MIERTEDHRYFRIEHGAREEYLSTTRAIVEANLVDDDFFTDAGRLRGRLVHTFVERIASNTLDRPIDTTVLPYLIGFRKVLDRERPTVIATESVIGNAARRYAGTIDLELRQGRRDLIWEIKTGQPEPWHGLQLAAYAYLKAGPKWLDVERFGLYLNASGGARLKQYDDAADLDAFFWCLNLLHTRVKWGSYDRPYGRRRDRFGTTGGHISGPATDDHFGNGRNRDDGDQPF